MSVTVSLNAIVSPELAGSRLDQAAAHLFPEYSRERLKDWIKDGRLTVQGKQGKPKDKVVGGEELVLLAELESETDAQPQDIPLNIVYEDDDLLVINKPAGLVVHPGAGNSDGTLMNALLFHHADLRLLPRAGIVHRIDKDTSGLLVVAKTLPAQTSLTTQLADKTVYREYEAIVCGVMTGGGTIDAPIDRHPSDRTRMAVVNRRDEDDMRGRDAVSHYRVIARFRGHTHVRVQLETGRTHQIRVHMGHIGHPLAGDPVYGGRPRLPKGGTPEMIRAIQQFPRQALHARQLGLQHPITGNDMRWESPLPDDMTELLRILAEDALA
ncbi:MAG: 23S rRNA pseudouridine(1911/1915/1917) synthase RluD [Moraxellaceae bacterium]|jgi:23S rRNA pseudouridine1911/1915/1917 synthase|nr:23S rRNA pseudouridine(1911/1915/1917) synthase RluD [Moraxellaceae bacterium]MBP7229250.1 23S rRNA pseudouridine(1911/1915/1917) synthase RluD [Moraxellaceae bacterium]MBP8852553.1 23S rRNA pseudouridine(1911/1915/1917) synthase RluD [Moraxellaceae bacterium]MBP9045406.1 23S rRNA pseudouridine(1911/1915/1917) synthase RluD [Moraxellaceae bacterium]MBP9731105.1 23S rRNA pseudouridine(1911/1915/1917) synthase RluD [Moraxellaceae bacterium]